MKKEILLFTTTLILFLGCKKEEVEIPFEVKYKLTFNGAWSENTHGFPETNDHFSPIIGAVHKSNFHLYQKNTIASLGIESMAEKGLNSDLTEEIENAINGNLAKSKFEFNVASGGSTTGNIEILLNQNHPEISLVSMIAPSPDWFVGIDGVVLFDGEWVNETTINLNSYDAGTENGDEFSTNNPETNPKEKISFLTQENASVLVKNGNIPPLASITFQRID